MLLCPGCGDRLRFILRRSQASCCPARVCAPDLPFHICAGCKQLGSECSTAERARNRTSCAPLREHSATDAVLAEDVAARWLRRSAEQLQANAAHVTKIASGQRPIVRWGCCRVTHHTAILAGVAAAQARNIRRADALFPSLPCGDA